MAPPFSCGRRAAVSSSGSKHPRSFTPSKPVPSGHQVHPRGERFSVCAAGNGERGARLSVCFGWRVVAPVEHISATAVSFAQPVDVEGAEL